jgi:hypothetical protein
MTTAANDRRTDIVATAAQTAFTYTFEIADQDDIVVAQNGTVLTITTHYTVAGVGNENGGTVTLVTGAAEDDAIAMYSDEDIARLADYTTAGDFKATTVNAELDKIMRLLGDNSSAVSRTLRLADEDPQDGSTFELPIKSLRLGQLLGFNATTGVPEVFAPADLSGTVVTSFANALLQLGTILAWQQALELEPGVDVQAYDADTVKSDVAVTWTKGHKHTVYDNGNSGTSTHTLDVDNGLQQKMTCTGSFTLAASASGDGFFMEFLLTMDGTGGYTVTFSGFEKTINGAIDNTASAKNLIRITRIDSNDAVEIVQL